MDKEVKIHFDSEPRSESSVPYIEKLGRLKTELERLLKESPLNKVRIKEILAEQAQLQKKIESFWTNKGPKK